VSAPPLPPLPCVLLTNLSIDTLALLPSSPALGPLDRHSCRFGVEG
jgi:hypothetical protein